MTKPISSIVVLLIASFCIQFAHVESSILRGSHPKRILSTDETAATTNSEGPWPECVEGGLSGEECKAHLEELGVRSGAIKIIYPRTINDPDYYRVVINVNMFGSLVTAPEPSFPFDWNGDRVGPWPQCIGETFLNCKNRILSDVTDPDSSGNYISPFMMFPSDTSGEATTNHNRVRIYLDVGGHVRTVPHKG